MSFQATKCLYFTLWLIYLFVSPFYWVFFWKRLERYIVILFIFFYFKTRVYCRFSMRKQEVLLNYMGTLQWRPHVDNFNYVLPTILIFRKLDIQTFNSKQICSLDRYCCHAIFDEKKRRFCFSWSIKLEEHISVTKFNILIFSGLWFYSWIIIKIIFSLKNLGVCY